MKNDITELVFILDRSGSMSGLEKDTIGGFNAMLEKQKKTPGKVFVTTVLFDSESQILHDRLLLEMVAPMTEEEYFVGSCTALYDAVGSAIRHISEIHKYARPEDVPGQTLFVITTDGMENASKHYNAEKVKKLIEEKKSRNGWEFLFLGANIDAVASAERFGISADHAVDYKCDAEGMALNFKVLCSTISDVRAKRCVSPSWKKKIEADFKERG